MTEGSQQLTRCFIQIVPYLRVNIGPAGRRTIGKRERERAINFATETRVSQRQLSNTQDSGLQFQIFLSGTFSTPAIQSLVCVCSKHQVPASSSSLYYQLAINQKFQELIVQKESWTFEPQDVLQDSGTMVHKKLPTSCTG